MSDIFLFIKYWSQRFNFSMVYLIILLGMISCANIGIQVERLTVELTVNPVGLQKATPRLGWQLASDRQGVVQTAYQVVVSKDQNKVANGEGNIWDSGKVKTNASQLVPYEGLVLEGGERYYWAVKIWDEEDNASSWSNMGYWEMAPDEDFLDASWIGAISRQDAQLPEGDRNFHAPLMKKAENKEIWNRVDPLAKRSIMLRKPFELKKEIEKATVYVSGLGHYELTINGKRIGDSEFAPLWSDYEKTVYYNTYEINDFLQKGENVLGVTLGNGMYNVSGDRYIKFLVSFGPPTLFMKVKLTYRDGSQETIESDQSWKFIESPITFNCIFGGEDYDGNLEQAGWDQPNFSDECWKPVVVQEAPKGKLRPQITTPVKIQQQFEIKNVIQPADGIYVMDMGQNLAGFPSIKVQGKKGQVIKLIVGEQIKGDSTVGQGRTGGPHYYEYTLKGEGTEEWQPKFSYYGYQYIQVENTNIPGYGDRADWPTILDIKSNFIYNDLDVIGGFESSNDIFSQTHILINNAIKSNMQAVFTDCPHREKLGWLEETHLNGPGLFYNYDLTHFVPKIMQDMADAQWDNGLVPNIAPEYVVFGGGFTDSPEWGVAAIVMPWMYYEYYGDDALIHEHYEVMKRYADYLTSTAEGHIVTHGLGDWYDYGEHAAGYSKNSPIALSATAHYFFGVDLLAKSAEMVGNQKDYEHYSSLAKEIKDAFNKEFFDPETLQYGTNSQFSNAIPIFLDMVDEKYKEEVLANLVKDIQQRENRLTTGDVGNRYLFQTLARNDLNEVMYDMHNHYDTPGYGFQIKFGLTTLTEQWDPRKGNSWNHFMMGQIEEWFYRTLAGIVPDKENPGLQHFFLKPEVVGDMTHAKAHTRSLYGQIASSWEKKDGQLHLNFSIPANSHATVVIPVENASNIKINSQNLSEADFVEMRNDESGWPSFILKSGNYAVICDL
ncbi:alpha-L-rhamnosidase [Anditalea andensis]|uniref:alpha-L-rhamnosidase n=1 Tax=Anditalea andensis TaxID=1048983 RepID=A0A074KZA6_9BACT|nr:alpha-L-rhamnosidase [Anditalea andensis]KEO74249.1 hydrolase [Anditalea andensis]